MRVRDRGGGGVGGERIRVEGHCHWLIAPVGVMLRQLS